MRTTTARGMGSSTCLRFQSNSLSQEASLVLLSWSSTEYLSAACNPALHRSSVSKTRLYALYVLSAWKRGPCEWVTQPRLTRLAVSSLRKWYTYAAKYEQLTINFIKWFINSSCSFIQLHASAPLANELLTQLGAQILSDWPQRQIAKWISFCSKPFLAIFNVQRRLTRPYPIVLFGLPRWLRKY